MANVPEEDAGEDVLLNNCRTKIEEIKANMTEQIEESRANMEPPEGEEWPEIEIKDSDIRVPDSLLQEILKLKLGENDCRNRGYILDSYPRTFKGAQYAFLTKPPKKLNADGEEEEEEEEDPGDDEEAEPNWDKLIKNDAIFPGSIIVMDGSDEDLIARVRELPEDKINGTHYNEDDMRRRIKDYRLANNSQVAEPAVQDFFKMQGIKFFKENMNTRTKDALNSFKIYIERVSILKPTPH